MSTDNTLEAQESLLTRSEMSAHYHSHRLRFLNRVHRFTMFFVALTGTAIFAKVFGEYSSWLGAAPAVIVLLELVFKIQDAHSSHQYLYREFTLLSGKIASTPNADEKKVRRWNAKLYKLHADEPPVYRALNQHMHNEQAIRVGDCDAVRPLGWWHSMLKNWFTFPGYGHKEAGA